MLISSSGHGVGVIANLCVSILQAPRPVKAQSRQ
jgi:hypothetical protein